jgi:hypothetical protein
MSKIIQSIKDIQELKSKDIHLDLKEYPWITYDGYQVTCTDGSKYSVVICNEQNCCENWGYLASEDDLSNFVGGRLLDVVTTDEALNTKILKPYSLQTEECIFVTFKTDKGDFQLVAYNQHNGYYGHDIIVAMNDKVIKEYR